MVGKNKVTHFNTTITTKQNKLVVSSRHRAKILLAAAIIIPAAIAAYSNCFDGVFLYDDHASIVENPHIRNLWPLSQAMSLPMLNSGATIDGRPILSLSFAVNYALLGDEPWGFHLVNMLIHISAALLLFEIVRRTIFFKSIHNFNATGATPLALTVALLWLVHPLQTESITYIVQRAESMMGMFFLLTLYCAVRAFQSSRPRRWYILAVPVCALGMATKEVMVVAPVIILLYDYVFISGSFKTALRKRSAFYTTLAALWVIPVILIILTRKMISIDLRLIKPLDYALTQPQVILHYLRLSLWPKPLIIDYNWPIAQSPAVIAATTLVTLSFLILSAYALFRKHWLGFIGAWFFLIIAPSSSFISTQQNAFEHRIYLSLAAVIIIAVLAGWYLVNGLLALTPNKTIRQAVTVTLVVAVTASFTYMTRQRNKDYHDEFTFWTDNIAKRPNSTTARMRLAKMLMQQDKLNLAMAEYKHVLTIDPNIFAAYNDIGIILLKQSKLSQADIQHKSPRSSSPNKSLKYRAEAMQAFKRAISIRPTYAEANYNLGVLYAEIGRYNKAIQALEQTLTLEPEYPDAHFYLGVAYKSINRYNDAARAYRQAVKIKPDSPQAHWGLGVCYNELDRPAEAIQALKQAVALKPDYAQAYISLGGTYDSIGRYNDAVQAFEQAIRIDPNMPQVHFHLGVAYGSAGGRYKDAASSLKQALTLNPNLPEAPLARLFLGLAYIELGDKDSAMQQYEILKTLDNDFANQLLNEIKK